MIKKALLVLVASFTLIATAQADIVDDILRTNYDLVEQYNVLFKVVLTKNEDGTERMALHLNSGSGFEWEHRTITRYHDDGWLKNLASREETASGAVYEYSYVPDESGRITDVRASISLNRSNPVTPFWDPCTPPENGCYTLREKNSMVIMVSFTRDERGTLTGGQSIVVWSTTQGTRVTLNTISFRQLSGNATRMVFEGWHQPWAYPLAGYELEKQPDGKRLLRVCYSFADDKCVTAR